MTTGTPPPNRPQRSRARTVLPLGLAAWLVLEIWLLLLVADAAGGLAVFLLLVAGLVGGQYYWIQHYHPIAFLGYVALMEGYPPTPELIDELIDRSGHPRAAFRTYVEHAELDPGHRDHLDRTIDSLPLDDSHEVALGISAIATAALAAKSIEELLVEP